MLQVIDFVKVNFCLRNVHFVETRMNTGLPACQDVLIHNVIHNLCGYREKVNKMRDLA
jgi:hypothetical protein